MDNLKSDFPLKNYYRDIYSSYDRVNRIFTFGRDVSWRRKAVRACLDTAPDRILDVCTGTGDFIFELVRQSSGSIALTGYDFSPEMLAIARGKKSELQSSTDGQSVEFVEGDVSAMPFEDGAFDAMGITFGIRNLVYENSNAQQHLAEMNRVLRDRGRLVVLESSKPGNPVWRFFNSIYLRMILPYLGGAISGNMKAYRYLARSSRNYFTKREMAEILGKAGFEIVNSESLFLGSVMLLVTEKKI